MNAPAIQEEATRVALVTGGGSGIGRAAAQAFARNGARIVIADMATVAGEETAHMIEGAGGEALFVRTDVSKGDQVVAMTMKAIDRFGRLDYAFNNAGIGSGGAPITETDEADWDRTIAINLKGVWLCMKYECTQMLRQGGGVIVNTSSMMGMVSGPGISAYSASKAGVLGLTRSVALDYARQGIRVNAVCPGSVWTAMTERPEARTAMERIAEATPMGRLGVPNEIADAVVWLCSDQASFITGQAFSIDGGFTAC
ncbi:glucose 1-dehydrogenase [Sphingomonas sp. C3-2]|uniref:glucose 1-dehydrogenase n=1 Tax=Sphingomonas sp. C3-2 TaxID=3062169 RepID=UPI00294B39FD|nr:glucose 1-dehydrogenase [Sphingomonas sp. C3-2]WOK36443.1 glucose 1-dehydrogenase [Sphingomonas sp. C3-2]